MAITKTIYTFTQSITSKKIQIMEEIKIYSNFDELIHPETQQDIRQGVANIGGIEEVVVSKTCWGSDEKGLDIFDREDNYLFSIQNGDTSRYDA